MLDLIERNRLPDGKVTNSEFAGWSLLDRMDRIFLLALFLKMLSSGSRVAPVIFDAVLTMRFSLDISFSVRAPYQDVIEILQAPNFFNFLRKYILW